MEHTIAGRLVDIESKTVAAKQIVVEDGRIREIRDLRDAPEQFILPGFIDAHVHVESSLLTPRRFAELAVLHGTIATVSDPHEIANVLGTAGVEFMVSDAAGTPFKFVFGAPSCVPATPFETAGAAIDAEAVAALLAKDQIPFLSEVMNVPGVLSSDPELMKKLAAARSRGKQIDGHAPDLRGEPLRLYASHGISTDHECTSYEEGREKILLGMKVSIREGSAARNFDALYRLIDHFPGMVMLCSDDKHADELVRGHINELVVRACAAGQNLFNVLRAACVTPVQHYRLGIGLLGEGDPADFIIVEDLSRFRVKQTWIGGRKVMSDGQCLFKREAEKAAPPNRFAARPISAADLRVSKKGAALRVIEVEDGQLVTREKIFPLPASGSEVVSDPSRDLLKLVVLNRYSPARPAVGFVSKIGLKTGAIASSVSHDSHNIVACGVDDEDIAFAINEVIKHRGGLSAAGDGQVYTLPLPYGGLMSADDGIAVGRAYQELDGFAKRLGTALRAPFMTLSFLALLVIPELKLSDKGLFDGRRFEFVDLFV